MKRSDSIEDLGDIAIPAVEVEVEIEVVMADVRSMVEFADIVVVGNRDIVSAEFDLVLVFDLVHVQASRSVANHGGSNFVANAGTAVEIDQLLHNQEDQSVWNEWSSVLHCLLLVKNSDRK